MINKNLQSSEILQEKWINEKQVAEITGLSCSTLQKQRHHGIGIPYSKLGSSVRYSIKVVQAFMAEHQVNTQN